MQGQISNLQNTQLESFQKFMDFFNTVNSVATLNEIKTTFQILIDYDTFLRGLIIIAKKGNVSGRELAEALKIPITNMSRKLKKWTGDNIISFNPNLKKGYSIKQEALRIGLLRIIENLKIELA